MTEPIDCHPIGTWDFGSISHDRDSLNSKTQTDLNRYFTNIDRQFQIMLAIDFRVDGSISKISRSH
jgi:hypothetical protein